MTKKTQRLHQFAKLPLAVAVAASMSTPASAFQFYMGDLEASFDTTLSAGASWRISERSEALYGRGNGGEGGSINSDDGNLNFDKNDTYSKLVKGTSDFLVRGDEWGLFARARYWYDFELKDENRATDANGYQRELSKDGRDNASGGEFLDAYIYKDFYFGEMPLNVRLGKQVVSWGESTFIFNGINVINPVDVGAIRAPGAELKEALIPVNMLYGSLGLTENVTLEGFIQLEHENSRIDDCGTYFSTNDYVADGCGPVYLLNYQSEERNQAGLDGFGQFPTQVRRVADKEADDTDQFGVAVRWYAQELNETEFAAYFIQYNSRLPLASGIIASDTLTVDTDNDNIPDAGDGIIETLESVNPVTGAQYLVEYPEQIQLFGLSFNTLGPGGFSLGGEYSFKHDMPIQLNSTDLVLGAAARPESLIIQDRVTDDNNDGKIDTADAIAQGFAGSYAAGFDLYDVSQAQMTAIKFWDQVLGASRLSFVGEVGATYVHNLPDKDQIRYGRIDQLSFGIAPDWNPTDGATALQNCEGINLVGQCERGDADGYVTDFSWGYRMRAALTYNDVFSGINMTPQLAWSHDVSGFAPGPGANFSEGNKSIGLSVRADYLNQYRATLAYTNYFGGGKNNALSDRDNVALSVSYSF
ncbi:MAG: hypothetical protein ACI8O8_001965 [Oleiphilaceae bacterium]|jgi:hypothetical protein